MNDDEMKWNDEMKTEMKKTWKGLKFFGIVEIGVVNVFEENFVWKVDQKSIRDMADWKNPGFEPEGKGRQYYAGFEFTNASLFLTESTLNDW